MLLKISVFALIAAVVLVAYVYFQYSRFSQARLSKLTIDSLVAETPVGPIEYSLVGKKGDPVLLYLHGSPGGYNQAIPPREGFRVLAPSRPGYLRTPISVGASPAQQASSYAYLLDSLGIESAIVIGASGGGPSAISFAAQYPRKTNALILIEAVSGSVTIPPLPSLMQKRLLLLGTHEVLGKVNGHNRNGRTICSQ